MFFLKRLTLAVFTNKRYSNKTMEIELEDCASYESFCYSIQSTKKSRFSSFFTTGDSESDSDSDDFNWGVDNSSGWDNTGSDIEWDDDNSNTEWTNDDQSYQDEIMDELEIVFEDETDRSAFLRKVNRDWNEANKDINKKGRSATKTVGQNCLCIYANYSKLEISPTKAF
ncbi:unnamed protein product [Larinioides sclopetarius]|uniref:Uncharacterized protein n=1 Tax=Larinioides sclopetarius TaxID=280406 RepID=A0AAV1YXP6_9ARAC